MKAIVVGGGIGGLSAAIALRRVVQLENPLLCGLRNALTRALPSGVMLRQIDPVVGYRV